MFNRRDVIYLYDGSFSGLLCAVFAAFKRKEIPERIESAQNAQQSFLCETVTIETEEDKAARVAREVKQKISLSAFYHVFCVYLSNAQDKGVMILEYIIYGFHYGYHVDKCLGIEAVNNMMKASQAMGNEAHLWIQFIRFSKLKSGVYYSGISPKCNVLPIISQHFIDRYRSMPFVIHDKTHGLCLIYNGKESAVCEADAMPDLAYDSEEPAYRKLWKVFFDTVEIKERHNEVCQRNHLPKWFRKEMTEFQELP